MSKTPRSGPIDFASADVDGVVEPTADEIAVIDPPDQPAVRDQAGKDVAVPAGGLARLNDTLAEDLKAGRSNAADAVDAIVDQIMTAETLDEILSPAELTTAEEILGVPLQIFNWRPTRSEYTGGLEFYAIIECVRADTHLTDLVGCGAANVVAQLKRMSQLGYLPATGDKPPVICKIVKSKRPTPDGNWPLRLVFPQV
jgi:hypothetical protein